jgi:hypothetical protein
LEAITSVVAKLSLLLNAVSDPWVNITEIANHNCALGVEIQATANQCGQDVGSTIVYFIGTIVGYVVPPLLSVMHGITFTSNGPV